MNSVLVIEDCHTTIATLSNVLQAEGYAVHAADSFLAVPRMLSRFAPQVVVLDLNMPVSGEDVGIYLNRAGYQGDIIIYSGMEEERLKASAKALRAKTYVSKDDPLSDLVGAVKTCFKLDEKNRARVQ